MKIPNKLTKNLDFFLLFITNRTAAHMCSILGREDLLQLLIAYEVNPFLPDFDAKTPMDYASDGSK